MTRVAIIIAIHILIIELFSLQIFAQQSQNVEFIIKPQPQKNDLSDFPQIEQILSSQWLDSGISNSADIVNKSLDSLMQAIFYSTLDHETKLYLTPKHFFYIGSQRDVFSSQIGAFIVKDTIALGPGYSTHLLQQGPVKVGLDSSTLLAMNEIYFHTNQHRIIENNSDDFLDYMTKNWLGLLPIAAKLLPPSFNQNELYNPLRLAKVISHHPLSLESFKKMPINSVRSYAFQGDLSFPIENDLLTKHGFLKWLQKSRLPLNLPIALILKGEYRISVLKKNTSQYWVGLQRTQTSGYNIGIQIGDQFHLLNNALPWLPWEWSGIPISIHPLLIHYGGYTIHQYNLLYEFNLADPLASEALQKALFGNFSFAENLANQKNSSVHHIHTKSQIKQKSEHQGSHNFFIANQTTKSSSQTSLIALNTNQKKQDFLQTSHIRTKQSQNIFTGLSQTLHHTTANIPIKKNDNKHTFTSNTTSTEDSTITQTAPLTLKAALQIQIPHADYEQTEATITKVFQFLSEGIPPLFQLPTKEHFLYKPSLNPHKQASQIHPQLQALGSLHVQCVAFFTEKDLKKAAAIPQDAAYEKIYQALDLPLNPPALIKIKSHLLSWISTPFRLLNLDIGTNKYQLTTDVIQTLKKLQQETQPKEKQAILNDLIDRYLPIDFIRALTALTGKDSIVRKAQFFSQAFPQTPTIYRHTYNKMNGTELRFGPTGKNLRNFHKIGNTEILPSTTENQNQAPQFKKVTLDVIDSEIMSTIFYQTPTHQQVYIYGKLSQAGKISVGKLHLSEGITQQTPKRQNDTQVISIPITGEKSFLHSFLMRHSLSLSNSEYILELALSTNKKSWSPIKSFSFQFQNGVVSKSLL
ncbi:MAG: hypothetical protein AB8C84_08485 [Oligoflexales bacterium]